MSLMTAVSHRRARLVLMLALCATWATTPLIAAICAVPASHCHRSAQMPCCPPSSTSRGCSMNLCPAQASQRAVPTKAIGDRTPARAAAQTVGPQIPARFAPVRELTSGLHFSPPVFRLKDDLRI